MHVNGTVANLQLLDYGLNKLSDGLKPDNKKGKRAIQLLSYFSHPIDLGVQAIAYPLLRLANPFVTVGVNIKNGDLDKAIGNTLLIPGKLILAIPKAASYEIYQAIRLGLSIIGFNTLSNVLRGSEQTREFFVTRMQQEERLGLENYLNKKRWNIGERKICYLVQHKPEKFEYYLIKADQLIKDYENKKNFFQLFLITLWVLFGRKTKR